MGISPHPIPAPPRFLKAPAEFVSVTDLRDLPNQRQQDHLPCGLNHHATAVWSQPPVQHTYLDLLSLLCDPVSS